MMDLHPYAGLAACNPGRTARFRRGGLLIALTWKYSKEWEAKVWGPNGVTPGQLEAIANGLKLDFYSIESYLSADFKTYVYVITGGRELDPNLLAEYESILEQPHKSFRRPPL